MALTRSWSGVTSQRMTVSVPPVVIGKASPSCPYRPLVNRTPLPFQYGPLDPPQTLAIPQLLQSEVWVILRLVMRGRTIMFTPGGLAPHQFTPKSGASEPER